MKKGLSDSKVKKIMMYFCVDITASKSAVLLGINRNTINRYYNLFREKIFISSVENEHSSSGEFEIDESYFGAKRVRGKRGRGSAWKTPVFGLLKRNGQVYSGS